MHSLGDQHIPDVLGRRIRGIAVATAMIPTEWIDYAVSPTYAGEVSPEYDTWRQSEHAHQRYIDRAGQDRKIAIPPKTRGITDRDMLTKDQINKMDRALAARMQTAVSLSRGVGHVPDTVPLVRTGHSLPIYIGSVPPTENRNSKRKFRGPL